MPLNAINYTNNIIYKIVCKDLNITDIYVGHTTSFKDRKKTHKSSSINEGNKNYNLKIYQTIRDNSGWDNWDMIEIEKYPCNDLQEARARERYWYERLSAGLNARLPIAYKDDVLKQRHNSYLRIINKNPNYNKEHYEKYKEVQKDMKKKYTECHKAEKSEYDKKRRAEKSEALKEQKKIYYEKNKELINEKRKKKYAETRLKMSCIEKEGV
jgi:hypothetical protein